MQGRVVDIHTFRKLPSHLPFGHPVYLRPAEFHAWATARLRPAFTRWRIIVRHEPKGVSQPIDLSAHPPLTPSRSRQRSERCPRLAARCSPPDQRPNHVTISPTRPTITDRTAAHKVHQT